MTKEDILAEAINIIADEGYDKFTLSNLANLLGVQKASLYYHFKSKEDIISTIYSEYKSILLKKGFKIDFSLSGQLILSKVYLHWKGIFTDSVLFPFIKLILQRSSIDEDAREIESSLDLMISSQSTAIFDNFLARGMLKVNNANLLSLMFSSVILSSLKKIIRDEEDNDQSLFIEEFSYLYIDSK